jgi:hypothetical protein
VFKTNKFNTAIVVFSCVPPGFPGGIFLSRA